MKKYFTILWLLLITACASQQSRIISTDPFLAQLQQGGYVIFFRHAATDQTQKDMGLSDCDKQRNLDAKGRGQSEQIGEQFSTLGIPVGEIKTSKLCRCIDTATLAFGRATPVTELTSTSGVSLAVRKQRVAAIKSMLSQTPKIGTNTVLVSHKFMFHDASDVWLEEGEAAIYKPDDSGGTVLVRRIKADAWRMLGMVNQR